MILELIKEYYNFVGGINSYFINDYTFYMWFLAFFIVATISSISIFLNGAACTNEDDLSIGLFASAVYPLSIYIIIMLFLVCLPWAMLIVSPIVLGAVLVAISKLFKKKSIQQEINK